jgi:hypothetical protein
MTKLKSWLGQIINDEKTVESNPLIVSPRFKRENLETMTKVELLNYAKQHDIFINARKRKEEIIMILLRN